MVLYVLTVAVVVNEYSIYSTIMLFTALIMLAQHGALQPLYVFFLSVVKVGRGNSEHGVIRNSFLPVCFSNKPAFTL